METALLGLVGVVVGAAIGAFVAFAVQHRERAGALSQTVFERQLSAYEALLEEAGVLYNAAFDVGVVEHVAEDGVKVAEEDLRRRVGRLTDLADQMIPSAVGKSLLIDRPTTLAAHNFGRMCMNLAAHVESNLVGREKPDSLGNKPTLAEIHAAMEHLESTARKAIDVDLLEAASKSAVRRAAGPLMRWPWSKG